jgi:hypothetical protein
LVALLLGSWASSANAVSSPISACPFSITAGGTYALTNDLVASGNCIEINQPLGASVTVNLNGFSIFGDGSGTAIFAPTVGRKISIVGPGTIAGFTTGIDLSLTTDATVKRLVVGDTTFAAILVGQGSISDSDVSNNFALSVFGVVTGDKSTVKNVIASNVFVTGIQVGASSTVTQSVADNNLVGITAGNKSRVKTSTANDAAIGIQIGDGGSVTESIAGGGAEGIHAGVRANINANTVNGQFIGIFATCPGNIQQNTVSGGLAPLNLIGEGCTVKNNVITP